MSNFPKGEGAQGGWLAQQIAQLQADVKALKAGQTTYVVNPSTSVCDAIIGDMSHDQNGVATGLSGWGVAAWDGTAWAKVNAADTLGESLFLQLAAGVGQVAIAYGGTNMTWSASQTSSALVVTHGLGRVPGFVAGNISSSAGSLCVDAYGATASQLTLTGYATAGVYTGTNFCYWIAIG